MYSSAKTSALLFDLDETLYLESDYVKSGLSATADIIAKWGGKPRDIVTRYLIDEFECHGREKIFNKALLAFDVQETPEHIEQLVSLYRNHTPDIHLIDGVLDMLGRLRTHYKTAIVTDGMPVMQRHKINSLGLEEKVDTIVYCWEHDAPKPSPKGYLEALTRLDADPRESFIIGDNPSHDFPPAKALLCRFVRVRQGRFQDCVLPHGEQPDMDIASILELEEALRTPPPAC